LSQGYVIYAFKEGSIRVINQSAKAAEFDTGKPQLGRFQVQDHFKLSNSSKVGSKMNYVSERNLKGPYQIVNWDNACFSPNVMVFAGYKPSHI